jgi:F-type H+-transporting ATPase subunit a
VAAEEGKIDPMHQFEVQSIADFSIGGYNLAFTNSALWMLITLVVLWIFMMGGMKRELVPGRWQAAGGGRHRLHLLDDDDRTSAGRPQVHPLRLLALHVHPDREPARHAAARPVRAGDSRRAVAEQLSHPFTVTSHLTITGVLAIVSFGIVLAVGFIRHGFHFFSLFVPHGAPGGCCRS